MPSPVSSWSILRRVVKSKLGKFAALLFSIPLWKLLWQGIDTYGNVRMIADNAKTVLSFLASWPGAIGLMALGCFLLWLEIKRAQARLAEGQAPVAPDIPLDGEALQPETLIGLFKTRDALTAPYIDKAMTTTGLLYETYERGGLKENTASLVLKRTSGATVIAHVMHVHIERIWSMKNDSEVTVKGRIVLIDANSVTIDEADIVNVKPAAKRPGYY